MHSQGRVLSIVIPALNEESAIGDTLERCLAARSHIQTQAPVSEVEIIVVSDGSTDRTEEIARGFPEVSVLVFERNRGYGAAIKAGFEHARGDWVGFLDADGTCDPRCFADLCRALEEQQADVVLGSRMGAGSEMPWIRAIGNTLFARMLGLLSKRAVQDTASGMRVIRRSALADIYPLPDGLHFTPAMTARVLLEGKLRLAEVPIPYAERIGRSKLSVLRDGVRFLRSIVQAAMCYQPARPLLLVAGLCASTALVVGVGPLLYWVRFVRVEEWMIYRVLLASLLGTITAILVAAAVVADRIAAIANDRLPHGSGVTGFVARLFTRRVRAIGGLALGAGAVILVWPGIVQYLASGEVTMHWSRAVLASLLVVVAVTLATAVFLIEMMDLIRERRAPREAPRPPDRVYPAREAPAGSSRARK